MITNGIDEWIYTKLSADGTITGLIGTAIFNDVAPQGTANPYILFSMQSGNVEQGVGGYDGGIEALYQVKAVAQQQSFAGTLATLGNRIKTALNAQMGTATDGTHVQCTWTQPIRYTEIQFGVEYRHLGAIFRIFAG